MRLRLWMSRPRLAERSVFPPYSWGVPPAPTNPTQSPKAPAPTVVPGPAPQAPDDAAMLARLKRGEEAAYEDLLRTCGPQMLSTARRFFRSEQDAQDAVQDAFLSAFKAIASFGGDSKLSTWLHRIVVNACLMKLRTRKRRPERSIEDLLPTFESDGHQRQDSVAWKPAESAGISRDETRRLVRDCIEQLPEGYRTVLILRDIEGLDTESAAAALELTPNALKIRLHRARQALRTLLDPHMRELGLQEPGMQEEDR